MHVESLNLREALEVFMFFINRGDTLALKDVADLLTTLYEQDIVNLSDNLSLYSTPQMDNAIGAANLCDGFSITVSSILKDALTVATRNQRNGDILAAAKVDSEPAIKDYDDKRKWKSQGRYGLEDGAIILR